MTDLQSVPDLLVMGDDFDAGNPGDLLVTLRAVYAEILRRKNSHRPLWVELTDLDQCEALGCDPGPAGQEARRLARWIHLEGYMVGVGVVADYGPNELPDDDTDNTQGATPSAKTTVAPCCPAPSSGNEVLTS
ncbi:hypothetical protein [Nonomuraea dietziae]|uniref:Uncharacterized protein n=1 Tax=Nonomuraea dietziae TaxID=65515 RepID=A0A7W5Y9T9_9ACTN|nr:hypothetical protein [Nonomuraea dietziae]MBB3730068.1 hypothetical protein [Nonomuraea dietziae]